MRKLTKVGDEDNTIESIAPIPGCPFAYNQDSFNDDCMESDCQLWNNENKECIIMSIGMALIQISKK